jgi:flagellar hook-associated protein 1
MNFLGLHIAAGSMANTRKALDIIGQNIANAEVEGYSRQEARTEIITSGYRLGTPSMGSISVGSQITSITRFRSEQIDLNYRTEMRVGSETGALLNYLLETSEIFTDISDFGLPQTLNAFWQAWNEAASSPGDLALRKMVLNYGEDIAQSIRMKSHKLDEMEIRIDNDIVVNIEKINTIIHQLAAINDQVVASLANTFEYNLLLDKRDLLLDELSGLADIQVVKDPKGALNIYLDGAVLVSQKNSYPLNITKDDEHKFHIYSTKLDGTMGRELTIRGGELKGLLSIKGDYLQSYRSEYDELARGLIDAINSVHQYGYGLSVNDENGVTGLNFFSGTSARDIHVSLKIPENLALSTPKLISTMNINVPGEQVNPIVSIAEQVARFSEVPSDSGTITINGVEIEWSINDTIDEIMHRIKDNPDLKGIQVDFDYNSQRIIFKSPPESSEIIIEDVVGNFTDFMRLAGAVTTGGEPGDGLNGQKIFKLATEPIFGGPPPTVTINDKYKNLVARIGFDSHTTKHKDNIQKHYIKTLDGMRQQVSGVSVDEELVHVIRYQRAFQAGAKLTMVIDEMIQSLINMVRA